MRLSHLLPLTLGGIWLAVFAGVLAITLDGSHRTQAWQMQSHAQDTATFLGLALSAAARNDPATTTAMVDALFDRGYYSEITVTATAGGSIVQRRQAPHIEDVPVWFVNLFPLATPPAHAAVIDGWREVANVEVVSHPGRAYEELWRTCRRTCMLLGAIGIASFLLTVGTLRLALAPLAQMMALARNVALRRFDTRIALPWTTELRQVAAAMNDMSDKVEQMLDGQTRLAEDLYRKAHQDPITELPNFRTLKARLDHWLRAEHAPPNGILALIHLDGFAAFNARLGRDHGDALLRQVTQALLRRFGAGPDVVLARGNGAEFLLLRGSPDPLDADALGTMIVDTLRPPLAEAGGGLPVTVRVGLTLLSPVADTSALLARADGALRMAQGAGGRPWHLAEDGQGQAGDHGGWRQRILDSLHDDSLLLHFQPVRTLSGALLHREALARIQGKDGQLLPAAHFMPLIRETGNEARLDRLVLGKLVRDMTAMGEGAQDRIAVNLCTASFADPDFPDWLIHILAGHPALAGRLIFEFSEVDFTAGRSIFAPHEARLSALGVAVAIDRFGQQASALRLIRNGAMAYIKIDGSHIRGIENDPDNQFMVRTLVGIAHGLGIGVIAEYVETAAEFEAVAALGIDAAQGLYIAAPQAG
ncbi:MAG: EAL domain-containing protein [Rhodocyclaceae bacterium]|nr:MAG: EAL domain-containing protein [Rhodocyclaceae bacterium]